MPSSDMQRISHIRDYCIEIQKTIDRYGNSFGIFDQDADYQRSMTVDIPTLLRFCEEQLNR